MSNVTGVDAVQNALDKYFEDLQKAADKALERVAELIVQEAKAAAPVQTGNLRDSIDHQIDAEGILVGVKAAYAVYIEFGDVDSRARPFFFPAVDIGKSQLDKILVEEFKKL